MKTLKTNDFSVFKSYYLRLTEVLNNEPKAINEVYPNRKKEYFIQLNSEEEVVATTVLFSDTLMKVEDKPVVCFGFFESKNDKEAVRLLFSAIRSEMKSDQILFGPMNGSTWDSYRVAINLVDASFPLDITNPDYYPSLLEEAGLTIAKSYASHIDKNFIYDKEKIAAKKAQLLSQGATIRNINLDQFDTELDKVYDLCMSSFTKSFLFSTIERDEFKARYILMKPYLQAEYIWFLVDEQDDLKGMMFALSFPGPNQTKGYMAKTLARVPDQKYAGIGSVLSGILIEKAKSDGCSFGVHAFMEADNVSNILSGRFSGEAAKRYHLYKCTKE